MSHANRGAILGMLFSVCVTSVPAQETVQEPPGTLSVYQSLAAEAIKEACAGLSVPESLKASLDVQPSGAYWFIEEALIKEIRRLGMHVVPAGGVWQLSCAVKDAHVRYTNVRRDGLLGDRVVDRTVALELWLRMSDQDHAQYLIDREWRLQKTDTIEVSAVSRVEHAEVPATRSAVPSEGFFSSWLEPLILVGAIGVAVFLLFTTRS